MGGWVGKLTPLTGAPSMTSNLVSVSDSFETLAPVPADSRRIMASSMCLILIRTRRK